MKRDETTVRRVTDAYRWGWDWAALGMELHDWLLPHLGTTQADDARRGFDDFRTQAREAGR